MKSTQPPRFEVADAADLPLGDESVDCIVTSPPYNVGMPYEGVDDGLRVDTYAMRTAAWSTEMARVLKVGGRLWINVPTAGPVHPDGHRVDMPYLWGSSLKASGLLYRDTVAWIKPVSTATTAWGSYLNPVAPNLRGGWEPILVYYKGQWRRNYDGGKVDHADEWARLTRNRWEIPPVQTDEGHPAPFPTEIPRRAILLSTWPGDTVLDPFAGSGTTLRVAHQLDRCAIGFDLSPAYVAAFAERGVQEVLA